jgi:DNA-directed RNA polymerase specialized sigma24 family protein
MAANPSTTAAFSFTATHLLALNEALETLGTLHPRQRQIVDEYHFGGYTLREIAEHLGVSAPPDTATLRQKSRRRTGHSRAERSERLPRDQPTSTGAF